MKAQRILLEYDDERSGSFEPLAEVPEDKVVVLGLVTTKSGRRETVDELVARIREAAAFMPLERLAISPQCGFATSILGNALSEEDERAKLATLVRDRRAGLVGMTVVLTGSGLTVADVVRVARDGRAGRARARGGRGHARDARARGAGVERGDEVYGVTTGVGARKKIRVSPEEIPAFNRRLIENHRIGMGPTPPLRSCGRRCSATRTRSRKGLQESGRRSPNASCAR